MNELILLINQARTIPVKQNIFLTRISEQRCIDMSKTNVFSHDKYISFYSKQIEKKYKYTGEILAMDFPNSTSTVKAWINSPSHNEILTAKIYSKIGCAVCSKYSVCLFGGK